MTKKIEQTYQKLTQREHILKRPGMYIGNINTERTKLFVIEDINDTNKIIQKEVSYNPGFHKLIDEILVNASDHSIRTNLVRKISINVTSDSVSVENDGPGIPVLLHPDEKVYIPELIFGHLLTGQNFDDTEDRVVGGMNGIGSKACNIYSKKFLVETADGKNKYNQEFSNNLEKIGKPKLTKSTKSYTKITFFPDFERFGLTEITEEMQQIILKRCCDIAVYCPKVKIYYNEKLIPVKSFKDYMKMHTVDDSEIFHEKINDWWEIGVSKSFDDNFQQVSMVNGINTYIGGTHVNFITSLITKSVLDILQKKYKKLQITPNDIKRKLFIFINCKVVNPTFDNQTKENLSTKMTAQIVKDITISDKFIKQIMASQMVEEIIRFIEIKAQASLSSVSGKKTSRVKIKKLDDANRAGTSESEKCMIFLTEGDSAKSFCISGFGVVGRDYYGVFPLKGKPLNVRDLELKKIKENDEIKNIVEALGLEFGKKYTSTKELRYGKVVFMSDADQDGIHIKGLLINLFDVFWPELLQLDFIYEFITPIVKIIKGKEGRYFYRLDDYKKWKTEGDTAGYHIKYYKGLGTIDPRESKYFFKNIDKHLIKFNYTEEETTKKLIDLGFNKKRQDDRKTWLTNYTPGIELDKFSSKQTYESFINNELIEFSMSDNIRSIPNMMDGFKPSQRKVIYGMFKKNYKEEIKVSQLAGAIGEVSAYHHGGASLEGTIVGMAQDFVGSNNVNLLLPNGQFGTRLHGGSDCSASRYIFTELNKITRNIFLKDDDALLNYLNDDGYPIEPTYYLPIIPTVLLNGPKGIGTGWSTDIPQYNSADLIKYIENRINGKKSSTMTPYYKGFKGEIVWDSENKRYVTKGIIEKKNMSSLTITELPIGMWNEKYYEVLDKLVETKVIKDYTKHCTDKDVHILISMTRESLAEMEESDDFIKTFKLETYISMDNINVFDEFGKMTHFNDIYQLLDHFYEVRLNYYQKRKDHLLDKLEHDKKILFNRINFIKYILKDELKINNRKKDDIESDLVELKIDKFDDSFDYVLNMPLVGLSREKMEDLRDTYKRKIDEIKMITETTIEQMWLNDLSELKNQIKKVK